MASLIIGHGCFAAHWLRSAEVRPATASAFCTCAYRWMHRCSLPLPPINACSCALSCGGEGNQRAGRAALTDWVKILRTEAWRPDIYRRDTIGHLHPTSPL